MGSIEAWTPGIAHVNIAGPAAARAEAAGWDGMVVVDSQNLSGDPYVALAVAAAETEHLQLSTGVTNPSMRHPAVTAAGIASVHVASNGRAALGIGRGDSALAHVGLAPAPLGHLERYISAVRRYLRGEEVPFDQAASFAIGATRTVDTLGLAGAPDTSRLTWLPPDLAPVSVDVVATGPKVLDIAARTADRVLLAVGAEPERVAWAVEAVHEARRAAGLDPFGIRIGAFVNVCVHDDVAAGRELIGGGLATFARFSVMHGTVPTPASDEIREVLEGVHGAYDMRRHTQSGSPQTAPLTEAFAERFGIIGPPERCIARLLDLADLGIDRFIVVGPTLGADPTAAAQAVKRFTADVLPALHDRS